MNDNSVFTDKEIKRKVNNTRRVSFVNGIFASAAVVLFIGMFVVSQDFYVSFSFAVILLAVGLLCRLLGVLIRIVKCILHELGFVFKAALLVAGVVFVVVLVFEVMGVKLPFAFDVPKLMQEMLGSFLN